MKNTILFISILLIFSCNKNDQVSSSNEPVSVETARAFSSSQTTFWYLGADCIGVNGDQGISADANIVKFGGGNFYMKSWWIAFYFTDTAGKVKWTQWGYATHKTLGNITILTTWTFDQGYAVQIFPPITHLNTVALNYGGRSVFSIYRVPGTTLWRFARDGVDIEECDLGTTQIDRMQVRLESQSSMPGNWSQLVNVKNFSSLKDGVWAAAAAGMAGGHFYASTGLSIWALEGRNQNPLLQPAEINMGGNGDECPMPGNLW